MQEADDVEIPNDLDEQFYGLGSQGVSLSDFNNLQNKVTDLYNIITNDSTNYINKFIDLEEHIKELERIINNQKFDIGVALSQIRDLNQSVEYLESRLDEVANGEYK